MEILQLFFSMAIGLLGITMVLKTFFEIVLADWDVAESIQISYKSVKNTLSTTRRSWRSVPDGSYPAGGYSDERPIRTREEANV